MSHFKGNNGANSTKFLMQERARFLNEAYKDEEGDRSVNLSNINVFENVYINRVDYDFNSVAPNPDFIIQGSIPGQPSAPFSNLGIVVDSFLNFVSDFYQSIQVQNLEENPYLSQIKVVRSYESAQVAYDSHVTRLGLQYNQFITNNHHKNSIHNFDDFVKHFLSFLNTEQRYNFFTLTAWHKSTDSSIFSTGTAFSIADLDCGDDQAKEEFFMNWMGFNYYVQAAADNGFNVSFHCPWVLFFNRSAAESQIQTQTIDGEVFGTRGITQGKDFIPAYYNKTYLTDIERLKNQMYNLYNNYIINNRYIKEMKYVTCQDGTQKLCVSNHFLTGITPDDFFEKYTDDYWIRLYFDIRITEENRPFSDAGIDIMKKNLNYFLNKLDNDRAINYINDQLRFSYYTKPGGINEYLRQETGQTVETTGEGLANQAASSGGSGDISGY